MFFYFPFGVFAVVVTVFNFIHFCMFQRRCLKICINKVANSTIEGVCSYVHPNIHFTLKCAKGLSFVYQKCNSYFLTGL